MANASSVLRVKMHINFQSQGWVESFFMKATNFDLATANFLDLLNYRKFFLASGCKIVYAICGDVLRPRRTKLILGSPVSAVPNAQLEEQVTPHDSESCVRLRLETADHAHITRLMRGIADEDIQDHLNSWSFALINLENIPGIPDPAITRATAWNLYANLLVHHTMYATKALAPAGQMIVENWQTAAIRGVGNRKTGRPHGLTRGRRAVARVEP